MDINYEQARSFFLEGVRLYQAGRFGQAERQFEASLALVPGRASSLTNLGATRLKLGHAEDALAVLQEALAQEPGNVEALGHCATALAELGRHAEALAAFDRVVALNPALGHAWMLRGSVLKDLGCLEDAVASFQQALAHGADTDLTRYYLASITQRDAPPTAPRGYVQALFDGYASGFDEQLAGTLHYQAPALLTQGLQALGRRFERALDLGCGTGLCGPLVKPLVARLDGVDLSAPMLAKARTLAVYDDLVQGDLLEDLRQREPGYDLLLAADVFIYVGALEQVFAQAARVLLPGGVFCFSVEQAADGEGCALRPSLRYAHSDGYIRALAQRSGLGVIDARAAPIREDQRVPVPGLYFWLRRP